MLWSDYLNERLSQKTVLDRLVISLHGENPINVPEIIKASVLITDKMISAGKKNMVVFPEQKSSAFMYVLLKTLFNISEGNIGKVYDPYTFIPGEKLKFRNSFFEFAGIESDRKNQVERIRVKFKDMIYGMPMESAPFLQRVKTKRLSKYESFRKENSTFIRANTFDSSKAFVQTLIDHKTHLESASVFVAPILNTKRKLLETTVNGERIGDFLLLAQADFDGNIRNMTSGQLAGIPAIVLCQDIYAVNEAINAGLMVDFVFVEASQNSIDSQLDALDDLIKQDKSVVLLADHVGYNDYTNLESRGFAIWTWNGETITPVLYSECNSHIDIRARNAAKKKINYIELSCPDISRAMSLLNKNRRNIENKSAAVIQVFQDLLEMSMLMLRAISPINNFESMSETSNRCKSILVNEKQYISTELYSELMEAADIIIARCTQDGILQKAATVSSLLLHTGTRTLIIVVPRNTNKNDVEQYIKNLVTERDIGVAVVHPDEYLMQTELLDSITLVSGWLNKQTMNKILCSHISPEIVVLLYECEKPWKNGYVRSNSATSKRVNTYNSSILSSIDNRLDIGRGKEHGIPSISDVESDGFDEVDEIELTLRQSRYRRYASPSADNSVEAIPVSFVSDLMTFYRIGRTLLTATRIIVEDYDNIEQVKPTEIQVGDFIIERETQRDLIRDIADIILKNSGQIDARNKARKWKEALEVGIAFSDEDTIYRKLETVGCKRGRPAIRRWLTDNDAISPHSKDDILFIAKATEDSILLEMADIVFEAGRIIKSAHIQAGHHLADRLKTSLFTSLASLDSIDGINVWEPVVIDIEDLGSIRILKVIDVGEKIYVDTVYTNRLIDTNRVAVQGV